MKYTLTAEENKGINSGVILTHACYKPQHAALCEFVGEKYSIKFNYEKAESPTGKNVYIFFFYPNTYDKAFQVGQMLSPFGIDNTIEIYKEECKSFFDKWNKILK